MNTTIDYYNNNAHNFSKKTIDVEFGETQMEFLKYMPKKALILDFGCGSGRDTKYFMQRGYNVEAVDGSEELCKLASAYTGCPVRNMLFQELNERAKYNGIWACSSILHLNKIELKDVLEKMIFALKQQGVIYTSFKYGDFEGMRNGRHFTDFTEKSFSYFMEQINGGLIEKLWITKDVRPDRGEERWLNLIIRKR